MAKIRRAFLNVGIIVCLLLIGFLVGVMTTRYVDHKNDLYCVKLIRAQEPTENYWQMSLGKP